MCQRAGTSGRDSYPRDAMQVIARLLAVVAKYATTLLATVALFATVAGCAPRYVSVHHYHETERVKVERDSVYNSDTVRIAERGDTVLMEVVKWRTRYKTATDTLVKVDTVQLPPELVTKIAPERKPLWAKVVAIIGGMLFLFVVLVELRKLMRMR